MRPVVLGSPHPGRTSHGSAHASSRHRRKRRRLWQFCPCHCHLLRCPSFRPDWLRALHCILHPERAMASCGHLRRCPESVCHVASSGLGLQPMKALYSPTSPPTVLLTRGGFANGQGDVPRHQSPGTPKLCNRPRLSNAPPCPSHAA